MKATELIKKLMEAVAEHGDLDVKACQAFGSYSEDVTGIVKEEEWLLVCGESTTPSS